MTNTRWADVRTENGQQIIILPAGMHLDTDRVEVHQKGGSGEITLSPPSAHPSLQEFIAYRDANPIPEEDWNAFHAALLDARATDLLDDPDRVLRILMDEE
jgi:virulence-associated protein VagC